MLRVGRLWKALKDPHRVVQAIDEDFHRRELRKTKARIDLGEERLRRTAFLDEHFGCDSRRFEEELRASQFQREFLRLLEALPRADTFGISSRFDCETVYMTVRAARPGVMVETGVLFGASSAYILSAMRANGDGRLISLDLPNPEGWPPKTALIPEDLRSGFNPVIGDSRRLLPQILTDIGSIQMFNHDSCHTVEHMMWEYLVAHQHLEAGGVLTSHDVLSTRYRRNAFSTFTDAMAYHAGIFRNFGVAVKRRIGEDSRNFL